MQVTIIPIGISAFGIGTKGLLKRLEELEVGGRVETIQMTALLRLEDTCCHSDSSEKPSPNADVKSSNEWIITLVYKEIEASTKMPVLPNLRVLNSNLKSVFTHHV